MLNPLRFIARLFGRLFRKKKPFKPLRDVSGIASQAPADADHRQETILTGGPWKKRRYRLALRDERLLPKPPPDRIHRRHPGPPKPKYLTKMEARRLFGPTFRTRNRDVMDLATDEAQLARYGLPVWTSEADIAAALGLTLKQLQAFGIHRRRDRAPHYVTFAIPKRNGKERLICAPKRGLKAALRKLDEALVAKLPVSGCAHGFVKGRSIVTNARPHAGKKVVLRFDIKDCFPTIHFGRIRGLFLSFGYAYPVAASLAAFVTESPRQRVAAEGQVYYAPIGPRALVQGAPTSPGLCNAVLGRLDRRLAGFAKARGFTYTRYADDLTFSGDDLGKIDAFLKAVPGIAAAEGFEINRAKTRVMRASRRQTVTGVVVNKAPGLSRQERRKLRAALHRQRTSPAAAPESEKRRLEGKLAYVRMINPAQAERLTKKSN